jgi:hypothetical protein
MARENDTTEAQIFTGILTQPVQSRIRLKRLFSKQNGQKFHDKNHFLYTAILCLNTISSSSGCKSKMHFENLRAEDDDSSSSF